MDYPPEVSTFTVTGKLMYGVGNLEDGTNLPNLVPVPNALLEFRPDLSESVYRVAGASMVIFQETVFGTTNGVGDVCGDVDGTPNVVLPYGGDLSLTPNGWPWVMTVKVEGFEDREFRIMGTAGGVVDLGTLVPVPEFPDEEIPEWEAAVATTVAARDQAVATAAAFAATPIAIAGNGFIALGDSISTSYEMGAGGAGYGAAWPHMACALSGQRLAYRGNAGVAGNNSTQILARVSAVVALKPRVVTILAGTNDLTQSVTFATWSANIKAIVAALRAAGIRPVLCTIPPRGNTTYLTNQLKWNRWLRAYAMANGLDLLDFFSLLVNPTTGMFASGYDSGDALHPSQAAHIAMANYVIANLPTGPYSPILANLSVDPGNLLANPILSAGGASPTSWIKGGSTITADITEGNFTDADFAGQAWEMAFTTAASATTFRTFTSFTFTGWSVGDVLEFSMKEKVTVSSGMTPGPTSGLRWQLAFTGGTPASITPIGADVTVHAVAQHKYRYTVPPGTTAIQVAVIVGLIPVGASFKARVGEFGVYNLTTEQLLTP